MSEFFGNVWNWFLINKDEILAFFLSAQFLSFLTTVVMLCRGSKTTKANTESNKELNQNLSTTTQIKETVDDSNDKVGKTLDGVNVANEELNNMNKKIADNFNLLTEKINAIIEVQTIVYSTIKDEKVRNTVNNLLTNAKYAETSTRAELAKQLQDMKEKFAEQLKALNATVQNTADEVTEKVTGEKIEEEIVTRY